MYVCILDSEGQAQVHKNLRATPETFLEAVARTGRASSCGRVHLHLVLAG
jgi:bacterioferritin-associated ferredoxin